jgi:acetyltransferase-like isoleucine patch superfamily enzyme
MFIRWLHLSTKACAKEAICRLLDFPFLFQTPFTSFKSRALARVFGAQLAPTSIVSGGVRAVNWRNIRLDDCAYVGPRVDLRSHGPITVGQWSMIGPEAMLISGGHNPVDLGPTAEPIIIGRGVFIGARAVILEGVTIGDHAMIGAGAVVTRNVPPLAVAVGCPARVTSFRPMPTRIWTVPGTIDLPPHATAEMPATVSSFRLPRHEAA